MWIVIKDIPTWESKYYYGPFENSTSAQKWAQKINGDAFIIEQLQTPMIPWNEIETT